MREASAGRVLSARSREPDRHGTVLVARDLDGDQRVELLAAVREVLETSI
jgi:hypothetical protein